MIAGGKRNGGGIQQTGMFKAEPAGRWLRPGDAGTCIALAGECRTAELLRLLGTQKRALLKTVHESQKCIDCLDYLVYQIERGNMI